MRRVIRLTLLLMAFVFTALGGAVAGLCYGASVGERVMGRMAASNDAAAALSQVRFSMVVLDDNDLSQARHQWAINLRAALFNLGALSKAGTFVLCGDGEKKALADAKAYVSAHHDSELFNDEPMLAAGLSSCEHDAGPEVHVGYLGTAGKNL